MCVLWRFIAVLALVVLSQSWVDGEEEVFHGEVRGSVQSTSVVEDAEGSGQLLQRRKRARDGDDDFDAGSLWQWLTGRDQPNRCVMVSVGGVIGGGALTGAFVGAGIGSIFTGPGTVVGAVVGGVVGMFGGISFGHRAGAAACDTSCGNIRCF